MLSASGKCGRHTKVYRRLASAFGADPGMGRWRQIWQGFILGRVLFFQELFMLFVPLRPDFGPAATQNAPPVLLSLLNAGAME